MGVYLSQPITDTVSSDYQSAWLKCGVSSMQGWRSSQEDAHNCVLDYDKDTSFFAVYDGHGGHEVAEYTARNLPEFLKTVAAYKNGDFEKALVDAFIDFDATLTEETVIAKLKAIAAENSDILGQDKDEDEVDVAELREEANMPLTELIAKYASGGLKNPAKLRVSGDSSSQPQSPYLKAKPGKQDGAGCSKDAGDTATGTVVNGVPETNGDSANKTVTTEEKKEGEGSSGDKTESNEGEGSSSAVNGEHSEESTEKKEEESNSPDDEEKKRMKSTIRIAKKKATVTMLAQLFEDNVSDSDSDNDESFHAKDSSVVEDDDDEDEEDAEEVEGEEDEEADEDGEEEEEESDEDESVLHNDEEYKGAGSESGCAAVVALLHNCKLYVANAGDSRAVLCRQGEAVDLSIDHKPDDAIEMERIQKAGGTVTRDGRVNGGLNLSRALGDHYYKRCAEVDAKSQMITALPDIQVTDIDPNKDEFLVIACDGIWNSMSSQEVVDFVKPQIKEKKKLSAICEELFERCLAPDTLGDGTGCDNMTCIIITFSPTGAPATVDSCKRSASPLPQDDSNKRPKVESPST